MSGRSESPSGSKTIFCGWVRLGGVVSASSFEQNIWIDFDFEIVRRRVQKIKWSILTQSVPFSLT